MRLTQKILLGSSFIVVSCAIPKDRQCTEPFTSTCDGDELTFCNEGVISIQTCDNGTTCDAAAGACVGGAVPFCGDGTTDANEECDDGNLTNGDTCESNCTTPTCGNGILDFNAPLSEECDDHNNNDNDACGNDCRVNATPGCGNGEIDSGEQCDISLVAPCDANCTTPTCGNGIIGKDAAGNDEQCDDGNTTNGDGCSAICAFESTFPPICGDGITQAGVEQCDDANADNTDGCTDQCVLSVDCNASSITGASGFAVDPTNGHCYAGFSVFKNWPQAELDCENRGGYLTVIDSAEENLLARSTLDFNSAWIGFNDINQEANTNAFGFVKVTGGNLTFNGFGVNEPNNESNEDCALFFLPNNIKWNDVPCTDNDFYICELEPITCGDGVTQAASGEQCDDGNNAGGDGCAADCSLESICGDGLVTSGEECDDGNGLNGDTCENDCTLPSCGNGIEDTNELCFTPPSDLTAGTSPVGSTVSGDFNEDGFVDIIASNTATNNCTVFFGGPNGTFPNATAFNANVGPTTGVAADFNNDGHLDYAVTNTGANNVSLLLGDGAGNFQGPTNLGGFVVPFGIDAADVDKDGDIDIVVGNNQTNNRNAFLLKNNGGANFAAPTTIDTQASGQATIIGVVLRDFNKDGNVDLLASPNNGNEVIFLRGDGAGTFAVTSNTQAASIGNIAAADFNNDSFLDFVSSDCCGANSVSVFFNNQNTTTNFVNPLPLDTLGVVQFGTTPVGITAADFNEDNNADIAVAGRTKGEIIVFLGNGAGAFSAPRSFFTGATGGDIVTTVDANQDGHLDLLAKGGAIGNQVAILWGYGNGNFTRTQELTASPSGFQTSVAVGDLNNDGLNDLVTGASDGDQHTVFLAKNGGTFNAPVFVNSVASTESTALADLDNDGDLDIVTVSAFGGQGHLSRHLNNGSGGFGPALDTVTAIGGTLSVVDLNNDGKLDVVQGTNQGFFAVNLGNGNGNFQPLVTTNAIPSDFVTTADLNNDGKLDAIAFTGIFLNTGNGTTYDNVANLSPAPPAFGSPAIADFNSDGKLDLIYGVGNGLVRLFPGVGDGTFQTASDVAISGVSGANAPSTADINQDGIADLIIAESSTTFGILLGIGNGQFQPAIVKQTKANVDAFAVADLNQDGTPDIVTSNGNVVTGNTLSLFFSFFN